MSAPDTPSAYAPRCGHHGSPLVWLDPALRWRCPHCFPELFPAARPAAGSSSPDVTALADEQLTAWLLASTCPAGLPHTGDDPASDHGHTDCLFAHTTAVRLQAQAARITELEEELTWARSMIGRHDPTGADHMEDAARLAAENDKLRAAIRRHRDYSSPHGPEVDDMELWAALDPE